MKVYIALAILVFSGVSVAQQSPVTKSFDNLWDQLYQKSYQKKAAELEKESHELSLSRSQRHWLPRVYAEGRWFSTNDPTQVFFTNLGQRSIRQSDFVTSDLNYSGRNNFKTANLGIDFPLYEGGMKSAQASMFESLVKASDLEIKAKKSEEYSELSRHFGGVLLHSLNERHLSELKRNLERIIANYQVGSLGNPIGHSGLLGLKGVGNRIEGMLYEFNLKINNSKKWINIKTESNEIWNPDLSQSLNDFLNQHLTHTSSSSFSSLLQAQEIKARTLDDAKEMEKSRFLPRVGLFANSNLYSGDRNSANAQSYGLYLMWDIFNNDSFGRVEEVNAKFLASQAKVRAGKQDEKIILGQLLESKATLEKSLVLLDDSNALLKEQTQNAMKLFRSGMLSALQLAEVINRRVDLLENKSNVEAQYLDVYTRLHLLNN
jgi:hypothetical protein